MANPIPASSDQSNVLSDPEAIQEGLRLGGVGVWRWRVDTNDLYWTRNLESVHCLPAGSFDGSLSSFQRDVHPDDAEGVWRKIRTAIDSGMPYRTLYRTTPRPDQAPLWIEACGGMISGPDGARYLTGICLDVSERVRGEQQLERRLRQQRAIARFGSLALAEPDLQVVLDEAVGIAAEVLAVPLTKILQFSDAADHLALKAGIGWNPGLVGRAFVGIDSESQAGFTLTAPEPVVVRDLLAETRFSGPPLLHEHGVRSGMSVTIPGGDRRPFGVFGVHSRDVRDFDETDAEFLLSLANIVAGAARQAAAADHRMLLVREMAHRAGNMLQLVSSIAALTFRAEPDTDRAREAFSERLGSMARANQVVARGGWTATRFATLVENTLEPFGNRVVAEGRDILLPPELCFDMGLVLHELATNSMKHGVLGKVDGRVGLRWTLDRVPSGGTFRFTWDDPAPATASPAKRGGFGSKLIGALVEQKWNGGITTAHDDHFTVVIEIPLLEPPGDAVHR